MEEETATLPRLRVSTRASQGNASETPWASADLGMLYLQVRTASCQLCISDIWECLRSW